MARWLGAVLFGCLLVLGSARLTYAQQQEPAAMVVEITFADQADATRLAGRLDVWEVNHRTHKLVAYVTFDELQGLESAGYALRRLPDASGAASVPNFACYRTVEETYHDLQQLAVAAPELAQWVDIGDTWQKVQTGGAEGYDLNVLVLTNQALPGPKPRLFVMAAIHARELATAEIASRFAEWLVAGYGKDPEATWLLDYNEIHILAQANPDGRKRAELDAVNPVRNPNSLWRKNVNSSDGCSDSTRLGVDLNRNSSFQWGACEGAYCSSGYACDLTYRGSGPASEDETQAIEAYLRSLFPDRRGPGLDDAAPPDTQGVLISLHSYSELVLFPWGWRMTRAPNDSGLRTLGRKLGYFTGYSACQSGERNCIYQTDGSTDDFAYGELGVAAYTFEVGTAFFQSCGSFESAVLPHTLHALTYAAKVAALPYQLPAGPDVVTATVQPALVAPGALVSLTVHLDAARTIIYDPFFGGETVQPIAGATYTVDAPAINGGGPALPLSAVDAFDSAAEDAVATIDTSGWSIGRHTIFVQASDQAGSQGPPTAVFLDVGTGYVLYFPIYATSGDAAAAEAGQ